MCINKYDKYAKSVKCITKYRICKTWCTSTTSIWRHWQQPVPWPTDGVPLLEPVSRNVLQLRLIRTPSCFISNQVILELTISSILAVYLLIKIKNWEKDVLHWHKFRDRILCLCIAHCFCGTALSFLGAPPNALTSSKHIFDCNKMILSHWQIRTK